MKYRLSKDGTNWYKPETTKTGKVLEKLIGITEQGRLEYQVFQFAQALPLTGQTLGTYQKTQHTFIE